MGLGNPGPAYEKTRHNVGFLCLERLAEKWGVSFRKRFFREYGEAMAMREGIRFILIKPVTFMNRSGRVIPDLLARYSLSPSDLLVVVDNMDLLPGSCRLKKKGSSAGHNGLKSIMSATGTGEFMRLYIGVGRPGKEDTVIDHVLGVPQDGELLNRGIDLAVSALERLAFDEPGEVINGVNRKQD